MAIIGSISSLQFDVEVLLLRMRIGCTSCAEDRSLNASEAGIFETANPGKFGDHIRHEPHSASLPAGSVLMPWRLLQ